MTGPATDTSKSAALIADGKCPRFEWGYFPSVKGPTEYYGIDKSGALRCGRRITRGDLCGFCNRRRINYRARRAEDAAARVILDEREAEHVYAMNLAMILTDLASQLATDPPVFVARHGMIVLDRRNGELLRRLWER